MKRILFYSALLFGLIMSPLNQAFSAPSVSLDVLMNNHEQVPTLQFKMKNISSAPITFNKADLPWGNRYSVLIVAVSSSRQSPLPATHQIDDPRPDTMTVKPGEELRGEISLDRYVEGLDKSLQLDDLLVFWHYDAKTKEAKSVGEFGGWFRVSSLTTGTPTK